MKKQLFSILLLLISNSSQTKAATIVYDFESGIPSEFVLTGGESSDAWRQPWASWPSNYALNSGDTQVIDTSIVYRGSQSLKLSTTQAGPGGTVTKLTTNDPITRLTFSIYDEFATNSPYYMYLFVGAGGWGPWLAWQDAPLSDSVLVYGGDNTYSFTRTPGWQKVEVDFQGDIMSYKVNDVFTGSHTQIGRPLIYDIAFCIDSVSGGTYSTYIDQIEITTPAAPSAAPEASSILVVSFAFCGLVLRRRRSTSVLNSIV
jgi:hypothetical protein